MRKSFYVCYVSLNELSRFPVILLGAKLFFYAIIWLYAISYLNTHLPTSLEKSFSSRIKIVVLKYQNMPLGLWKIQIPYIFSRNKKLERSEIQMMRITWPFYWSSLRLLNNLDSCLDDQTILILLSCEVVVLYGSSNQLVKYPDCYGNKVQC